MKGDVQTRPLETGPTQYWRPQVDPSHSPFLHVILAANLNRPGLRRHLIAQHLLLVDPPEGGAGAPIGSHLGPVGTQVALVVHLQGSLTLRPTTKTNPWTRQPRRPHTFQVGRRRIWLQTRKTGISVPVTTLSSSAYRNASSLTTGQHGADPSTTHHYRVHRAVNYL